MEPSALDLYESDKLLSFSELEILTKNLLKIILKLFGD